jgi:hypothetical protein
VRPLKLEQLTSWSSELWFAGGTPTSSRPLGSSRLASLFLAGIVNILSPSIGSPIEGHLKGLRLMAQSYVGKPPISKRIGSIIRRFVVSPVTSDVPNVSGVRPRNSIDGCGRARLLAEFAIRRCVSLQLLGCDEAEEPNQTARVIGTRQTVVATDGTRPVAGPHHGPAEAGTNCRSWPKVL